VAYLYRICSGAEIGLIHSGCLRADDIIPRGAFTQGALVRRKRRRRRRRSD